ncbi:MAG TPA: hypothetical protein VMZ29_04200 [Candidatus Bathyarchaeia archaeon]|nr:hypothetical protein [Candidatus Bathyarchaeia archaeon]
MSVLTDILINLAASVLFFILGYLTNKMINVLSLKRNFGRFWNKFLHDPTMIVIPSLPKESMENKIPLYYTELKIGSLIDEILRKFNKDTFIQEEKFASDKLMNYNLILIGSPSTNKLINEIFKDTTIPIDFEGKKLIYKNKSKYETIYDEEKNIIEDYGVIIFDTNYYNRNFNMIIIAGNTPIGTYNAAKVVSKIKYTRKILKYKFSNEYILIVKTKVIDNFMAEPEIILIEQFRENIS